MRDAWLAIGLCTNPSDRSTAESAVAQLYRWSGCPEPNFVWVPSPPAAAQLIASEGLAGPLDLGGEGIHRAPARIASLITASRERMDKRIDSRRPLLDERAAIASARKLPSQDALDKGVRPDLILRSAIWDSLRTSLFDGVATAIRTLLPPFLGGVTWYGQQESHRLAFYDAYRRTGLARYRSGDHDMLDVVTALARSTGWWWAFDDVCVMAERPCSLYTERTPGGVHNERRLHRPSGPAIEFSDGSAAYVINGTIVPDWVVLDPTVERIARERKLEVRRSAIERIGWSAYIDEAGLDLIDCADDPGNPGCTLQLFAMPDGWGLSGRILLVVNGSLERDGHRRRYGLHVPGWIPSALDAGGWTYGISGADYARLVRRT
ncbi:hypothetical protein QMK17_20225 [Rhodococcus sp. G-MC3]|uniref:DUF6745 domain-containing protein n=1 Tax=Rhodococcus sp. G-MC3 TaxID=3046209 RepID=UPI0024B9B704|nr:hypothetical protein [Rhodococcus sp. G-MC3]MDJ0395652.1 hypothetical protein [Rhodococcus sp. G-MC3]